MSRLIRDTDLLEELEKVYEEYNEIAEQHISEAHEIQAGTMRLAISIVKSQPPADQWIPVSYHETTEEEKELYGMTCPYILDCPLPEEGSEILVCTKRGNVFVDEVCYDEGFYLDGGYDFVEDIVAWMPLPEPYKAVE